MAGTSGHSHAVCLLWPVEEGRDALLKNGSGSRISPLLHELKPEILKGYIEAKEKNIEGTYLI